MEQWRGTNILPSQVEDTQHRSDKILAVTSGNVQVYALDTKPASENQVALTHNVPGHSVLGLLDSQYPFPTPTLPSNDQAANLARLQARRQKRPHGFKRRVDAERPYLQYHKYIEYRARRRQDTGPDGQPVWDDPMEEAFQNALCVIKPMGRKKKSQNGKPNGRNELIAEWIYRETGKARTRKQVSSHIQVLNGLLKGIPEWDALVAAPDKEDEHSSDNLEYHSNSIEQAVKSRRRLMHQGHTDIHNAPYTPGHGFMNADQYCISNLNFEMWVTIPKQTQEVLHSYTRLQSHDWKSAEIPLEELKNWRESFPHLHRIVESWAPSERCDIILLNASFQPMEDFAPEGSKLGINLELNFTDPSNSNYRGLSELQVWSGSTQIYSRGRLLWDAKYDDCHLTGVGKVKLFFESKFWAEKFTLLTEKKRKAEDSKNEAAIEAANESSQRFFGGLTAMQEIHARPSRNVMSQSIWMDEPVAPRRMAILLWKFSQAQSGYVGTTTCQRLIPPPDRMAINSPPAIQNMGLLPFSMDAVVDMSNGATAFDHSYDFLAQLDQQHHYNLYDHGLDEELSQNGILSFREEEMDHLASMQTYFGIPDTRDGATGHELHHMNHYQFDLPILDAHRVQVIPRAARHNFLELQQHQDSIDHLIPHVVEDSAHHDDQRNEGFDWEECQDSQEQSRLRSRADPTHDLCKGDQRRPLDSFDHSTHRMLQAQLSQKHDQVTESDNHDDEALRAALVAASAMNDLGSQHQAQQSIIPHIDGQQSWMTANPARPPYVSHASFPSQPNQSQQAVYAAEPENLHDMKNQIAFSANHMILGHGEEQTSTKPGGDGSNTHPTSQAQEWHHEDEEESRNAYGDLGGRFADAQGEVQSLGASFVDVRYEGVRGGG